MVWLPLHTRQIVLLNAGPQVIYGRGNVFAARIHYHTAVGLSGAPSSLSKINTRNKRGRFEVTCVKALEGAREDARTACDPPPYRVAINFTYPFLRIIYKQIGLSALLKKKIRGI